MERIYACIDLKSFYASVECALRGLDPLTTNLVVADASRTEKTICLAVSPSLKKYGIPGRARLFEVIKENALSYGIGIVSAEEIDELNIYEATKKAMKMAINNLKHNFDLILTDAMPLTGFDVEVIPIIKGDAKALPIAAASILAKVTRDRMMKELAKQYPEYGFDVHKGYGTKKHMDALKEHGALKGIHRFSYKPIKELELKQMSIFDM